MKIIESWKSGSKVRWTATGAALLLLATATGCAAIAVATAPRKQRTPQSEASKAVADRFWTVFHGGKYDQIEPVLEDHLRVLVEEPADPVTISHAGWLHAWRVSEANRRPPSATVIGDATVARRYFEEASALVPEEARYRGFLASFTMAEADILHNERQMRQGYFAMKDAISAWPEFNLFTSGYTMSGGPASEAPFQEGLAQQWETLDRCFGEKVSRNAPDLSKYLALETREGPKRACWNSWIAPHNWEGFFTNFGDMLVRAGDTANARAMYQAAKLSRTYDAWPYRGVLERRLDGLDGLKGRFEAASRSEKEATTMFKSAFSCMGCHQESGEPSVPGR